MAEIVFEAAQKSHNCGVTGMSGVAASRRRSCCVDVAGFAGFAVVEEFGVVDRSGETMVSVRLTLALFLGG